MKIYLWPEEWTNNVILKNSLVRRVICRMDLILLMCLYVCIYTNCRKSLKWTNQMSQSFILWILDIFWHTWVCHLISLACPFNKVAIIILWFCTTQKELSDNTQYLKWRCLILYQRSRPFKVVVEGQRVFACWKLVHINIYILFSFRKIICLF